MQGGVLKKRTKTNRVRGGQAYLYVRSVKKLPDFQTAGRVLSDTLLSLGLVQHIKVFFIKKGVDIFFFFFFFFPFNVFL